MQLLEFIFPILVITWKSQQIGNNIQTCQVFVSTDQSECQSGKVIIKKIDNQHLICLAGQNNGYSSVLYVDGTNNQYFISLVDTSIFVFSLPYACSDTEISIGLSSKIQNYSMTLDSQNLYIFGGGSESTVMNSLLSFSLQDIINGRATQTELANNYISKLIVTLTLWDETLEDYTFTQNPPLISTLQSLQAKFSVVGQSDSGCTSVNTPGCLKDSVMVYIQGCNCLQLFYGTTQDNTIQMKAWAYYIDYQVWQEIKADNMIKIGINPVGAYLSEIVSVAFYGQNKYFFFSDNKWFDNYGTVPFGDQFSQMVAYQNVTFLVNSTSAIYSNSDQLNIVSQQFGIYKCQDDYSGYDCQATNKICPGSICFSDLFYGNICIYCSGHGTCTNGSCKCDDGYDDIDCGSYTKCLNDCSKVGNCIGYFPLSQCRCPQDQKRGGEDCSTIFCLNDCSNSGVCNSGTCACNAGSKGDDCSILSLKFIYE